VRLFNTKTTKARSERTPAERRLGLRTRRACGAACAASWWSLSPWWSWCFSSSSNLGLRRGAGV